MTQEVVRSNSRSGVEGHDQWGAGLAERAELAELGRSHLSSTSLGNKPERVGVSKVRTGDTMSSMPALPQTCVIWNRKGRESVSGGVVLDLLLGAFASFSQAQKPTVTTLCSIVGNPKKFDGRLVQFAAYYESDGIERSVLVDEANCKWGIAPQFPEKLAGEEKLEDARYTSIIGALRIR
jgi:hypothetical protein